MFILVFSSVILTCLAHDYDRVRYYSKDDFTSQISKRNNFVMFFAPWCSHCERFSSVWKEMAAGLQSNPNIAFAKVDCTIHTELCYNQDITGYPTLKLYKVEDGEGKKFRGSRDIHTLKKFITEVLGDDFDVSGLEDDAPTPTELTDDTFEDYVSVGIHFIQFYVPWNVHCQELAPVWLKLAQTVKDDIIISKVDCSKNRRVCQDFNISVYPTLVWITDGRKMDTYYEKSPSLSVMEKFVSRIMGNQGTPGASIGEENEEPVVPGKSVLELSDHSFYSGIENDYTFVKFFAPWCGHCKRLAPTWEELAQKLSHEENVKIAHVDCTLQENNKLCDNQKVDGYPTLLLYKNGVKISQYNGSRVLEDLIEFVKRHTAHHDEL